jgi:hypothetical protein
VTVSDKRRLISDHPPEPECDRCGEPLTTTFIQEHGRRYCSFECYDEAK